MSEKTTRVLQKKIEIFQNLETIPNTYNQDEKGEQNGPNIENERDIELRTQYPRPNAQWGGC